MDLLSLFRRKKPEPVRDQEISIDQWSSYFKYNGSPFGYSAFMPTPDGKREAVEHDFAGYVNGAYKASGVVFACCMARMMIFSEVRFAFQRYDRERPGDIESGKGRLDLLESPWPNGTTGELLSRAMQDADMAGNHYVVREDRPGQKPRLRRLRPDWVEIVLSEDPTKALRSDVVAYIYKPGGTSEPKKWEVFPVDGSNGAIAHWSPIPDPEAQYRGMSWMTSVLREIEGDRQISKHKNKFFQHGATPNIAVSLNETVTPEQFQEFMEQMNAQHRGVDNAYKTLYLGGGADVKVIGSDIRQLDFKAVAAAGETRIAAAARVHPVIVGLSDGLQGSSLNEGNFNAAKDAFASGTMRPLWRSLCAAYQPLIDLPEGVRLWYDDREIAFLREDREKVARLQKMEADTISALIMQGFKPDSVVQAVLAKDWSILEGNHSGLYSVQLLPPEISKPELAKAKAETEAANSGEGADTKKPSKANNHPTGSKRKPVGRPPKESKSADIPQSGEFSEDDP